MFFLIPLPYSADALEPVISAHTLSFHHGKHLQTYVDNLNKLIAGTEFESMSVEDIVVATAFRAPAGNLTAIFNNAGQILNHNLYFGQFRPAAAVMPGPTGHLMTQIEKQWGTLDSFKQDFVNKGISLFGSGWVWLSADPNGFLVITQEPGANNPIARVMPGSTGHLKPLLTFDVWEHAYYLDYQNRRAAHLEALWEIVDWSVVEGRYENP